MDKYNIIFSIVFYNLILVIFKKEKKRNIIRKITSFDILFSFNFQYFFLFNFLEEEKRETNALKVNKSRNTICFLNITRRK